MKTRLAGLRHRAFAVLPRPLRVEGPDRDYVHWAVYPDGTAYLLNTDCVSERTVSINGAPTTFAPKEMKVLKR